jgi:hypothetical protein
MAVKLLARIRAHNALHYAAMFLMGTAVVLASAIVSSATVDLGPSLRGLAERQGSRLLRRPIHIGALKIRLFRGRVEIDDLVVDGLHEGDRPFFKAGRLSFSLDWSKVIARQPEFIITSGEMSDWQMLVEKFPDGDSFPRFRQSNNQPRGPRRFTSTMQYFRATRGQFAYEDHEAPWSILAPGIDIAITNFPKYHGEAKFKGGLVTIQRYVPMWADFNAQFTIDGNQLKLHQIEMVTDGARSTAVGQLEMDRWPEQTYQVTSRVHFPRMRELFFEDETWNLTGDGDFKGVFHLFKGGFDLAGDFESEVAGVNAFRFPDLAGSLHWQKNGFAVTDARAKLFGGDAKFDFGISPLGSPIKPTGTFDVAYENVDLASVSDFFELAGLRTDGTASGRNRLEWPMGRFRERRGDGELRALPPASASMMQPSLAEVRAADADHQAHEWGPFAPQPLTAPVPVAGGFTYRFDPDRVEVQAGEFATESTHVAFSGQTAWGADADFRFHVVSRDWQESDVILAGILTDFGARTGPVAFGGRGEFDGAMTGTFRRPRVTGTFIGDDLRAWDTIWGDGSAGVVIENNYVTITDGVVRHGDSEILAEGRFSLGYPRRDGGDEIEARFHVKERPLDGVRHAFQLDDWPVSGRLSGDFALTGAYEHPFGQGSMSIEDGVAFGEPFQKGVAALRFDGLGVRLDAVTLNKATGTVTGAAFVGWDGTYSFNADGRRIPAEHVTAFTFPRAQPSGVIDFTATGSSTFADPRYDVRFRMNELVVAAEPVGIITGTLALRGKEVNGEMEIASSRLAITGTGRIALDEASTSELTFRFHDSSLDPYVRLFVPRLSPYTTAVASGAVRIVGELANLDRLLVDGTVDRLDMTLFDYAIRNARPIRVALDRNVVRVQDLQLVGDETQLTVSGSIGLNEERIALRASGDASLGILQGFFKDVRGAGRAVLTAAIDGPLYDPIFSGSATIADGRVRHFSLPNSLDAINGTIRFDSQGVQLDDVAATMGGGRVQFGGRIGFDGYLPGDLSVNVRGEDMHLRYPEGIRSTVDADLVVHGNFKAPTLGGQVTVKSATWNRRIDPNAGLLDFGGSSNEEFAPAPAAAAVPMRFDIQVLIPSTLRVENNLARLVASADLQLRGTYDRPLLFGRAEVDRGEVTFEGRRYVVTRGNIDFTNPSRIEPFFDVEAQTRVRAPGLTYHVTVRAIGTPDRLQPELSSDPPLPPADVLALLFSDAQRTQGFSDAELSVLQANNRDVLERDIIRTRATQMLASPVSSEVGRIVEQTFGVDSFQVTPSFIDPYSQSSTRVNPSARVTIGKRVSDRLYLTFSRNLSSSNNDQILLLEYDASDRLSWILSRNEDSTYAIEVRVRHAF